MAGSRVSRLWQFLSSPRNQKTLGWLGGGAVVLAGGVWTVVAFFSEPPPRPKPTVDCTIEANRGLAACGDVDVQGPVTIGGAPPASGGQ